ncbi:MAG: baseplate J/gp47 family protein [Butyrivibrio sp.]|nr:baseplate J/gp47 family protein [Butyrivibrio sp.]
MSSINFLDIDSKTMYANMINGVEEEIGEELVQGDERRLYTEALIAVFETMFASINEACRQKLIRYATGDVLDALAEFKGLTRKESVKATCTVRFSLDSAITSLITIPEGTRVTSDNVRYFATTEAAVITAGITYVDVECEAKEGGADYNDITIGEITTLVDEVPYIDTVSNTTTTSGGSDEENDDTFRERILTYSSAVNTAGSAAAYKYYALAADSSIADAMVTSPSAGVVQIVPLLEGGEIPDETMLATVLEACSADDVRPLTDQVTVAAPTAETYDIELTYYTTSEDEAACVETIEGDDGAIALYEAWQCAALGRDINPDYLRKLMLAPSWTSDSELVGCTRVEITSPTYTALDETTVAQFSGNLTVSHVVYDD